MTALMEAPPGLQQRREALERANEVRAYRKELKADLRLHRRRLEDVLWSDDPRLATMTLFDLLMATPKVGRVKARKVLAHARVSPTRALGSLGERERREVIDYFLRR